MGNYQADKVVVADTLDPHFDPATLEVISSSHALELAQNGPAVQFIFDPIILPAAQNDEPGSHGFVKYSVRLREGASTGTGVKNTAYIYFDFNPAIVTNTVTTTVSDDSLISIAPDLGITWRIYPNPAHEQLFIRADRALPGECMFTLFDLAGKALGQQLLQPSGETVVRVPHLAPGLYLCRITDGREKVLTTSIITIQ
jgi:hypothetical protein